MWSHQLAGIYNLTAPLTLGTNGQVRQGRASGPGMAVAHGPARKSDGPNMAIFMDSNWYTMAVPNDN